MEGLYCCIGILSNIFCVIQSLGMESINSLLTKVPLESIVIKKDALPIPLGIYFGRPGKKTTLDVLATQYWFKSATSITTISLLKVGSLTELQPNKVIDAKINHSTNLVTQ